MNGATYNDTEMATEDENLKNAILKQNKTQFNDTFSFTPEAKFKNVQFR